MSLWKKIQKTAKSTYEGVTDTVETVVNAVGKVIEGDAKEGLGDIGETYTKRNFDLLTLGNTRVIDEGTGGLLTKIQKASRGNTGDIFSLGQTALAIYNPAAASLLETGKQSFFGNNNVPSQTIKDDVPQWQEQEYLAKDNRLTWVIITIVSVLILFIIYKKGK